MTSTVVVYVPQQTEKVVIQLRH